MTWGGVYQASGAGPWAPRAGRRHGIGRSTLRTGSRRGATAAAVTDVSRHEAAVALDGPEAEAEAAGALEGACVDSIGCGAAKIGDETILSHDVNPARLDEQAIGYSCDQVDVKGWRALYCTLSLL